MKITRPVLCSLILLLALGATGAALAAPLYLIVEGTNTGAFKSDTALGGQAVIAAQTFHMEATVPRDPATGMATGKRQYGPLTITKPWSASSPQFFEALVNNEMLKRVVVLFPNPAAGQPPLATITLNNAVLTRVGYRLDPVPPGQTGQPVLLEDLSFAFEKITLEALGGTMAMDSTVGGGARLGTGVLRVPIMP